MQPQSARDDTLPWLISFSLDLMSAASLASFVFSALLLASCAEPAHVAVTPVRPQIIGNVKSVSSADIRAILDLIHTAMLKEHHSLPTSMTLCVIDHDHVMIFSEYSGHQYGDPVERKKGKWTLPEGPRVTVVRSNQTLQPTADRRKNLHTTTSTLKFAAQLGSVSGG
jgi:hypothetical protein